MFGHDNQDNQDNKDDNNNQGHFGGDGDQQQADQPADNQHDDQADNQSEFVPAPVTPTALHAPAATDDLLDIKHEALQALTPLVGQLDQTPEEQFRTTMMMIQASDNHALVQVAYEAAKNIANEKERAQALLDIVNEINYFTQQNQA